MKNIILQTAGRICLLLVAGILVISCRQEPAQPNILLAVADDWSWPHASIAGTKEINTPAFDQIASEGVLFTHAFCSSPSCTPSRGALLTGQYHWRLENNANLWSTLPEKYRVYPDLLEENGYLIGYTGKGWGPGLFEAGGRERNPAGPGYLERTCTAPDGINKTDYFENFKSFLEERTDGQPFCFWYGGFEPHRVYQYGIGLEGEKDPAGVSVPAIFPDHDSVRIDMLDYFTEVEWFDHHLQKMIDLLEQMGELDNTLIIVTSDNGMPFPRCKSNLYDLGTNMPLAIRWGNSIPSERVIEDFISLTDLAPTILEAAGVAIPGEMTGKSIISMLLSGKSGWIEKSRDQVMTGKERHAWVRQNGLGYPMRAIRTKDYLYIRNFKPNRWPAGDPEGFEHFDPATPFGDIDHSPTKHYMMNHQSDFPELYNLGFGKRPAEELYDLQKDPDQVQNVAMEPSYQEIKKELYSRMIEELTRTADPRVIGRGDLFDKMPYYKRGSFHYVPDSILLLLE